jgi:DNA-binding NtrC family response regulator
MTLRARVLVVDDEESLRTSISKVLQFHGFAVVSAADLTEAVDKIETERFDVVLTDLRMSGPEDGLQVIEAVRNIHPGTITFLMSAHANLTGSATSLGLRSDEVLPKPTDIPTLIRRVNERLAANASVIGEA